MDITQFKVIQGYRCRYQSKAYSDFLLVININLHPISLPSRSYRRLLFKFWTKYGHFAFWAPFGGL